MTVIFCGVDVSSQWLDASLGPNGPQARFANTAQGIGDLAAFCRRHAVVLVAMEATGGYERQPFALLSAEGIPCAIVNPRSVRRFAEAMGVLEKTDRIDSGIIAWYAQTKRLRPTPLPKAAQQRLTALVTRLRQLTEMRVAQLNQRRLVREPELLASFEALLALIGEQIRQLETAIAETINADRLWAELGRSFRSIKGVADRTTARLFAHLPEIGTLSNKAVAKLAGLAPIARDSGKRNGRRPVRAGRESVRSILFVVAELVRRYNPDFADFHQRLSSAGKPKKLIRVALARKLLVRLNAKARDVRNSLATQT